MEPVPAPSQFRQLQAEIATQALVILRDRLTRSATRIKLKDVARVCEIARQLLDSVDLAGSSTQPKLDPQLEADVRRAYAEGMDQ